MTRHVFMYLNMSQDNVFTYLCGDNAVVNGTIAFSSHNDQNEFKCGFFIHVMSLVPAVLSCDSACNINGIFSLGEDNGNNV